MKNIAFMVSGIKLKHVDIDIHVYCTIYKYKTINFVYIKGIIVTDSTAFALRVTLKP